MKLAIIEASFPELPSPKMYQNGRGEGGTMKVAIRNAVSNLLKNRSLAHKRISIIKCNITVTDKADADVQFIHSEDDNVDENVRSQHDTASAD